VAANCRKEHGEQGVWKPSRKDSKHKAHHQLHHGHREALTRICDPGQKHRGNRDQMQGDRCEVRTTERNRGMDGHPMITHPHRDTSHTHMLTIKQLNISTTCRTQMGLFQDTKREAEDVGSTHYKTEQDLKTQTHQMRHLTPQQQVCPANFDA
jgi:hypothetical protein